MIDRCALLIMGALLLAVPAHGQAPAVSEASEATAATGQPQPLTADEVGRRVGARFGVEVLRVDTVTTTDGRDAYRLSVMQPQDAANAAFRVDRLLVDARSGALIAQFRHQETGYIRPPAVPGTSVPRVTADYRAAPAPRRLTAENGPPGAPDATAAADDAGDADGDPQPSAAALAGADAN